MSTPRPNAGLEALPIYGTDPLRHLPPHVLRLDYNESPYGPSPAARATLTQEITRAQYYPDPGAWPLRTVLAQKHKTRPEQLACGAGSDELIGLLARTYAGPGDEILSSQYAFLSFANAARAAGATSIVAPANAQLGADVDALLERVSARTKILFLANPNNPTGTVLPESDIRRLRTNLRGDILLVLDAAYGEFTTPNNAPHYTAGDELVSSGNVVVLRTFSKIYGLGGLRVGWAHAPQDVADTLNRSRRPYNVSTLAQAAALASLQDTGFIDQVKEETLSTQQSFATALRALGLTVHNCVGNYLLVNFETAERANQILLGLRAANILVRDLVNYGLPSFLRISLAKAAEMEPVYNNIRDLMQKRL